MAFCQQHGLSYSTFATWIQKRRREQAPESECRAVPPPAFAEVVIDEGKAIPKTIPPLRVILRSGVSFEVVSADQVPLAAGLIQSIAGLR